MKCWLQEEWVVADILSLSLPHLEAPATEQHYAWDSDF